MENILFKKSYQLDSYREVNFKDLWNNNGIFTTIRVLGRPYRFVMIKQHLKNLNKSLKEIKIYKSIRLNVLNNITNNLFDNKYKYDHLLRIAVNSKLLSLSLRTRPKPKKNFIGYVVDYQRPNFKLKNLTYQKILKYIYSINTKFEEIILTKKNFILEGCTTNLLLVKNKNLYMHKEGFYPGITLKFFQQHLKNKITKKDINIKELNNYNEIILVGSGKGVVSLYKIEKLKWKRKQDLFFKKLFNIYNKHLNSIKCMTNQQ
jgi:branched-subunit amino acid aminotransferase/4-amino-4-deoxychorismate lyase